MYYFSTCSIDLGFIKESVGGEAYGKGCLLIGTSIFFHPASPP